MNIIRLIISKIRFAISTVGPGLFLIGYSIGIGNVTIMAKSGAGYGMGLFWVLVLSCIFTYILMVAFGKVTLVTGKTILYNIRTEFRLGWILSIAVIVILVAAELLAMTGLMGMIAELLQEEIRVITGGFRIPAYLLITFWVILLYSLLWIGHYHIFEKVLTGLVMLMGLSFILVLFLVKPEIGAIARGLVPAVPDSPKAPGLIAAIVGSTFSAALFVVRSTVVAEKGWTIKDLGMARKDSLVSVIMMLFLSGIIMVVAAGTLNYLGLRLDNTVELVYLFEPIGGKIASAILILGVTGAAISTALAVVLVTPWLIADFRGRSRNLKTIQSRILIFVGLLFAFGSVFIRKSPTDLLVLSQAILVFAIPLVTIPVFIFINREGTMKNHQAKWVMNAGLVAAILFSILVLFLFLADWL